MEPTPQQVCEDFLYILGRFKRAVAGIAEAKKLTTTQVWALFVLKHREGIVMGEVANVLHCDPSNVTGLIDRLVAHKLVERQECPTDRRAKMITLTSKGKRMHDEIMTLLPERLGYSELSGAERAELHAVLQKLLV